MTGLCHLPALRWISLLQVAPARVMTEEGKSVSRQITHLERLLCVCLQWMFFLEGNSCSISCRKRGLFIQFKWKEQNQEEWSVWKKTALGCAGIAGRGLRTGCSLCLLCWIGKGGKGKSLCCCGTLWMFPPLPFPHETFWVSRGLKLIKRLGIDAL